MSKKEKKNDSTVKGLRKYFTKKNFWISVLVVVFLIQFVQIQSMLGNFSFLQGRDSGLITEIGQLKEAYLTVGSDLNEVRDFLRMPTSNYGGFDEDLASDEDTNKNQLQLAMFNYVEFLNSNKQLEQKLATSKALLEGLGGDEAFMAYAAKAALTVSALGEDEYSYSLSITNPQGEQLLFFYLAKEDGVLYMKSILDKEEVESENLGKDVTAYLSEKRGAIEDTIHSVNDMKAAVSEAIASNEALITELGIDLKDEYIDKNLKLTYQIFNSTGEAIGEIVINTAEKGIWLNDLNNDDVSLQVTDVATALGPFLKKLDTKTFIEKKADEALNEVVKTVKDGGFVSLMEGAGLKLAPEKREDEDRVYFDILGADGGIVSSFVVEKATGVVNIVDSSGNNAQNILFFDPEFKKKTLELPDRVPEYGEEISHDNQTFNILIAGKHGSLVDTMIFTHIDEERREIEMISIPRDLFYNGRKINSLPYYYGMPELKKVLSEITGYELDKYILIDMYSFIDVVDLVGGIDITLPYAVVDPTYRTVDNGVEGTLHYEPGDYHLGGKEALRLARSRHTSSDFARAERQQLILEALQTKARNFGFGDADTIYEIAKTILGKTETDIDLDEALAYYFRYQNYEIKSNSVMSSGNVLEVPPYITKENCERLIAEALAAGQEKPGCENENQAYTLMPRDGNWNLIKWFFREHFDGA